MLIVGRHSTGSGGGSCNGDCQQVLIIIGYVIGGVFGLLSVIFAASYIHHRCNSRSSARSDTISLASLTTKTSRTEEIDCFKTGIWSSRYYQYKKWHGPYQLSLSFDRINSRVDGNGTDEVGTYIVEGTFCSKTNRIDLTKVYKQGTGDSSENFGHKVTIQLTWNPSHHQFAGKWLVQTNTYHGEDKFELKFEENEQTLKEEMKY